MPGPQGTAFQHPELVEQEERVVAGATEVTVPCGALLFAMGRADRTVHVEHDVLQPSPVEEAVDPLAIEISERRPVTFGRQTFGLEPAHLRRGGCLTIDGTVADHLSHHRIMGQPLGVVDVLVSREAAIDSLSE